MLNILTGRNHQHVKQSKQPPDADLVQLSRRVRRTAWERLRTYNIVTAALSNLLAILALCFIIFVWYGAQKAIRNDTPSPIWLGIVNRQWTTRFVTISAILIRVSVSAQMAIFAATVTTIILETTGVLVTEVALLSAIRTINNNPQSHIRYAYQSLRQGHQLIYAIATLIAVINTLALQFSSTLLLGDFDIANVELGARNESMAYGTLLQDERVSNGYDPWTNAPSTCARFGEFHGPSHEFPDYVDTGSTLRAYLPLATAEERIALQDYSGPASVIDTRVICMAPLIGIIRIKTGLSLKYLVFNITTKRMYPGLNLTDFTGDTVMCTLNTQRQGFSICDVSGSGFGHEMLQENMFRERIFPSFHTDLQSSINAYINIKI